MNRSAFRAVATVLVAMIPVAALLVWGFIVYTSNRESALTERNYRALAACGRQIADRIESLRTAVDTAAREGALCEAGTFRDAPLECARKSVDCLLSTSAGESFQVCAVGEQLDLYFRKTERARAYAKTKYGQSLGDLIDKLAEHTSFFDTLMLATSTGEVLYQTNRTAGNVSDIGPLVKAELQAEAGRRWNKASKATDSAKATTDEKGIGGLLGPGTSGIVRYLGKEYRLFSMPVKSIFPDKTTENEDAGNQANASGPSVAVEHHMVLVGLVPEEDFTEETREIPTSFLIGLLFTLGLAILALPVLRLWFIGPHERVTGIDIRMVVICGLAASAILTFALLDLGFYGLLAASSDRQLEDLAADVENRLSKELKTAESELEELIVGKGRNTELPYSDFANALLVDATGQPVRGWMPCADDSSDSWYPVELSRGGTSDRQNTKRCSTPLPPLPKIPLGDRPYFADALNNRLWSSERPFAAEVVRSRVTGALSLVLAVPLKPQPKKPQPKATPKVALIVTKLLPFVDPVVPVSFAFAVVDQEGRTQISSLSERSLVEDFFRECDEDPVLIQAVRARRPQFLNISYYGRPERLYTAPIKDTPWSIVVLRDKQLLEAVNSETTTVWAILSLLYLTLIILILAIELVWETLTAPPMRLPGSYRAEWLWPRRNAKSTYWWAIPVLMVIAFAGFLFARSLPDWTVKLGAMWVLSGLAVGFLWWWFAPGDTSRDAAASDGSPANETWFRLPYVLMACSLLVVLAVVPSAVFFGEAEHQENSNLLKLGQVRWVDSLAGRTERVSAELAARPAVTENETKPTEHEAERTVERTENEVNLAENDAKRRLEERDDLYPQRWLTDLEQPLPGEWLELARNSRLLSSLASYAPSLLPTGIRQTPKYWYPGLQRVDPDQPFAAELREVGGIDDKNPYWSWKPGKSVLTVDDPKLRDLLNLEGLDKDKRWGLLLPVKPSGSNPVVTELLTAFLVVSLAALVMVVMFPVLWSVTRMVFLLDADRELARVKKRTVEELQKAWTLNCSTAEKLAMRQLDEEGFLSPNNTAVVRGLFEQGLIERNTAISATEALKPIVEKSNPTEVAGWESDEATPSAWSILRIPLLAMLAIALLFLFYTQRDLLSSTLAIGTSSVAFLPSTLRVLTLLGGGKRVGTGSES